MRKLLLRLVYLSTLFKSLFTIPVETVRARPWELFEKITPLEPDTRPLYAKTGEFIAYNSDIFLGLAAVIIIAVGCYAAAIKLTGAQTPEEIKEEQIGDIGSVFEDGGDA